MNLVSGENAITIVVWGLPCYNITPSQDASGRWGLCAEQEEEFMLFNSSQSKLPFINLTRANKLCWLR